MLPRDPARLLHKGEASQRASFLELFFDLVFVFALTRVVARAAEDLTGRAAIDQPAAVLVGATKVLFLLLALWSVWHGTAWTTSRYDPYQPMVQATVLIALVAGMVMGVAIPRAFSINAEAFVAGYLVAQLGRSLLLAIALRGHVQQRLEVRMLITYAATAVLWILGLIFAWVGTRLLFWLPALVIEYLANRFGWPVPGLGRSAPHTWSIAGEHLAERYQQFFLVALGEAILVTGLTYAAGGRSPASTFAFALTLTISIVIWRIYFYRAGQIFADALARSRRPAHIGTSAADSHLLIIIGVITTAIGFELAITHPTEHAPLPWLAVILGGPALFMVGRSRFEYEVFNRVSPSRLVAIGLLLVLVPALLRTPTLVALAASATVLTGVALADARRAWGKPPEPPAPPI
ncbi:low temperature requirement protein A [Micromonospora zingiberis]|uniref:Low temperature requirement protein A n=1 Tax=Micromonospora zingiberis TaxID=2053011 RepID=A0A4R0G2L6_9ACTN|nr:low temperature requirement protein A [Micromonospora zingiberis]TCB90072.1 low temperature requirement protein A [Micromonospora zingiberis]